MPTMQKMLSVIMPACNAGEWIGAALDSLINQRLPIFEIIIVNDGSTDNTVSEVNKRLHAANIKLISTENRGAGPARNTGIECATGRYIYFLDADDLAHPDFSAIVCSSLATHRNPDVLLFSGASFRDKNAPQSFMPTYERGREMSDLDGHDVICELDRMNGMSVSACLYVSKLTLWRDNELLFKNIVHEDDEIFIPLLLSARRAVVLDQVLFYRRIRRMSIMTSPKTKKYAEGLLVNLRSNVALYGRTRRSESVRPILRKKSVRLATRYMQACRIAGVRPEVWVLLYCAWLIRSPRLLRKGIRAYLRASAEEQEPRSVSP